MANDLRNTRCHKYGDDLISALPDEILQHILSFIPTKLAIRTSVLSKRWEKIWCKIPSLSFAGSRLTSDTITKTLIRYTATKIINFHLTTSSIVSADQIDSWIDFVMSRNTEKLYLEFDMMIRFSRYNFPDYFYNSSFVKELTLKFWRSAMNPRCNVSWTSLKSLSLSFYHLSDEYVAKVLSGCPILESLTLSFYGQLQLLNLSKSMPLSRLDIHCKNSQTQSIVIVAPHIHYLRLRNSESPDTCFTLQDVSSLTEADLDLRSLSRETALYMGDFQKMLTKLQNVKELTLGANYIQVLSFAELHGVHFQTINLEALTLEIVLFTSVLTGITKMLQTSPSLKKINVHLKKEYTRAVSGHTLFNCLESNGLNRDQSWKMEDEIYQTTLGNYPVVMRMEADAKFVFWLVEFLLRNAKTVETMVLFMGNDITATVFNELQQMVPTILRGNKTVSILLKRNP